MDFFFQAEDGIRDGHVTGVQTCALPIYRGDELEVLGVGRGRPGEVARLLHHDLLRADELGELLGEPLARVDGVELDVAEEIGRASCRERMEGYEGEV